MYLIKFFYVLKSICVLFIFSIMLIFCFTIRSGFKSIKIDYNQFITNFNFPIYDIVLAQDNCPYSYVPLISDSWGGFQDGCVCETEVLFKEKCNFNKKGCRYSSPVPPKGFDLWKGKLICVWRRKEYFGEAVIKSPFSKCDPGYKYCGIFDAFNNILCQPFYHHCPYNHIEFVGEERLKEIKIEDNPKIFNISEGTYLIVNNSTDQYPNRRIISNFKLLFSKPCAYINDYLKNYEIERSYFNATCEKELDPDTYTKIDEINFLALLKENKIINNYLLIPSFKTSGFNHNISLYRIDNLGMYYSCLNDKKLYNGNIHNDYQNFLNGQIINFLNKYELFQSFTKSDFSVNITYIFITFLAFIYLAKYIKIPYFSLIQERTCVASLVVIFVTFFFFYILYFLNFYFSLYELNSYGHFYAFKDFNWKCSNDYLNEYFFNLVDLMNKYSYYLINYNIFLLYVFVFFCIELCFWLKRIRDQEISIRTNSGNIQRNNRQIYGELQEIR